MRAALRLDFASDLFATEKGKGIPVHIFEASGGGARWLQLGRMMKADPALAPFLELGEDVFRQEDDPSGTANELVFVRVRHRSHQQKHGSAIGRSDSQRAVGRLQRGVRGQSESQLIQVESPAAILIANENGNASEADVVVLAMSGCHSPQYSADPMSRRFAGKTSRFWAGCLLLKEAVKHTRLANL